MIYNKAAIGVFDSGVGGLTVLNELMKQMPHESFVYLGDTARLPYGTKSVDTIRQYALQMASILLQHQIKLLVIACNTATAASIDYLKTMFPQIPIIGVIEPAVAAALRETTGRAIAVLATETTTASGIYPRLINKAREKINVISYSCGLLVALAEEGCTQDEIAVVVVSKYLQAIQKETFDCILLGCTHFPVFIKVIQELLGNDIKIINSAKETALAVKDTLSQLKLESNAKTSKVKFLVTDSPERFKRISPIFLDHGFHCEDVILVDGHNPMA